MLTLTKLRYEGKNSHRNVFFFNSWLELVLDVKVFKSNLNVGTET